MGSNPIRRGGPDPGVPIAPDTLPEVFADLRLLPQRRRTMPGRSVSPAARSPGLAMTANRPWIRPFHAPRPKPNIRVTSRKGDGSAASTSLGSMGRRAFRARWKRPEGRLVA